MIGTLTIIPAPDLKPGDKFITFAGGPMAHTIVEVGANGNMVHVVTDKSTFDFDTCESIEAHRS